MRCEEFASSLEAWLDGELGAEAAAAAAAHAASCPVCAEAVGARHRLRDALRELAELTPPADLRAGILAAAAAEAAVARRRWRPLAVAGLAAAALLLAAFGLRGLLSGREARAQHGCLVIAYLDGAYEEPGAIGVGELTLAAGPGALPAPRQPEPEGGKR